MSSKFAGFIRKLIQELSELVDDDAGLGNLRGDAEVQNFGTVGRRWFAYLMAPAREGAVESIAQVAAYRSRPPRGKGHARQDLVQRLFVGVDERSDLMSAACDPLH